MFVRTIESAIRDAAVQNIIQDETGTVQRLALYNTDAAVNAEEILPTDALFAIKEPYFAVNANNGCSIRVDHPSDLVQLGLNETGAPEQLRADLAEQRKSALDWKEEGNAAFGKGNHLSALHAYNHGLEACDTSDSETKRVILRNRALVNIYLIRFEQALADAKAAVIPVSEQQDDQAVAVNIKAYQRAGHAAYKLNRFQEAEECFKKVKESAPGDEDATRNLQRIEKRVREQSTGEYDFEEMSKSASKKRNRLDHADFTSNTTIKEAGAHGRGLFAMKDIRAGQLVICEKALCVSFGSDEASQTYSILDHKNERGSVGTQATLLFKLVQKLLYSPEAAADFFELFDGSSNRKTSLETVDSLVPINAFRVLSILNHNSYGCPAVRSSSKAAQKQIASQSGYQSTGLWLKVSYINHACDGNVMRSFIGDMMIVRATKDISKGDEILMPYRLPNTINSATQDELQRIWGFKCDCGICVAEAATPLSQRKQRAQLIEKSKSLLSARPLSLDPQKVKTVTAQIEKLLVKIRNTYDEQRFENRPRLGLVAPGLWLCQAYRHRGQYEEVIKTATDLIRDLGFIVTIRKQTLRVDRTYCQLEETAVDAAIYAARAYHEQGATRTGKQMKDFAAELYVIMNGESRGFEDRFNEI